MSYNFLDLVKIKKDLSKVADKQIAALQTFHTTPDDFNQGKINRFVHFLKTDSPSSQPLDNRVSITSTTTCIKSIILADICPLFNYEGFIDLLYDRYSNNDITTTGLENGNPFTIGLLLPILNQIKVDRNIDKYNIIKEFCIEKAKSHLESGGISMEDFPKNGYLTYYNLIGVISSIDETPERYNKTFQWSKEELLKQISFFEASDEEEADVFQLGYNFLIQYAFCRHTLRESIVDLCLKIIFNSQLPRGVWEKRTPLFNYAKKGDAFPFSFELLNAIFKEFDGCEDKLIPYEENIQAAFEWTKKNAKEYSKPPSSDKIFFWKSVSRNENCLAESWATSEVYLFIYFYKKYISKRIQKIVLSEFDGRNFNLPNKNAFKGFYLPKINFSNDLGEISLDEFLINKVLQPLKNLEETKYSLTNKNNPESFARSGIMFGPPGTGKTTYAKCIAKYLGWPLIIINPSDFAKEGIALMPRMATEIFSKLMELEDTVIFFDEMEALIKCRDNKETLFEQQFLTTTFLPKLQTLHDKSACIFLVATNYIKLLDPAAKREGRFDFRIQILPPSIDCKITLLSEYLSKHELNQNLNNIKIMLEYNKDALKYSTFKEYKRLLKCIVSCKCDRDNVVKLIKEFNKNLLLKDEIADLKAADKENVFDS